MFLVVAMLACSSSNEADVVVSPPAWVAPDQVGPYAVGATTRMFTDKRGIELTMEIWYPARDPNTEPDRYPELPIVGQAHRDADVDHRGGPYPLVAFSHGFGGIRYQSSFLTEHLASHGFVVVSPDHPNNTLLDLDDSMTVDVMLNRPADVAEAVDAFMALVESDDGLAGLVDDDAYAMVGHSFGGFTSLVLGGGQLDLRYGVAFCESNAIAGCFFMDGLDVDTSVVPEADPRVQLIVPLTPGGWYAFGEDGIGLEQTVPSLVLAGDRDTELPYNQEAVPIMNALASPSIGVTLHGAGHWGFSDLCAFIPLDDCAGEDKGYMDPIRAQSITRTMVTAAVGDAMTGNADYRAWLDPDVWGEDVSVTTR